MWKQLITSLQSDCEIAEPASAAAIAAAEKQLAVELPADLRQLLLESNGVTGRFGPCIVWPIERIATDNLEFRGHPEFRKLYMPFEPLLFFGDDGSGDQYAFRILDGRVDPGDVFVWVHENDAREWYASNLRDYFTRALRE